MQHSRPQGQSVLLLWAAADLCPQEIVLSMGQLSIQRHTQLVLWPGPFHSLTHLSTKINLMGEKEDKLQALPPVALLGPPRHSLSLTAFTKTAPVIAGRFSES